MEDLKEQLVIEAFDLAKKKAPSHSKNGLCDHIKLSLEKKLDYTHKDYSHNPIKSFARCYDKYIEKKETDWSPGKSILNLLSIYLGYEDYTDYIEKNSSASSTDKATQTKEKGETGIKNITKAKKINAPKQINADVVIENNYAPFKNTTNKTAKEKPKWLLYLSLSIITVCTLILVVQLSGIGKNVSDISNQCMVWNIDRYQPIKCEESNVTSIPFDEVLLDDFRKVEVKSYMNKHAEEIKEKGIWRGESANGDWDYFTTQGKHPLTHKPLQKVSYTVLMREEQKETDHNEKAESGEKIDGITKNNNDREKQQIVSEDKTSVTDNIEEKSSKNFRRIGVFIFNDSTLDLDISRKLENKQLISYNAIGVFLNSEDINLANKQRLAGGDFSLLSIDLLNRLDYICAGSVIYTYTENKNTTISCKMVLTYDVLDRRTGLKIKEDSKAIHLSSIGFDRATAKANVIKKIDNLK